MATAYRRDFAANEAVREKVPLLIGLMGPSGSGKTFSALRLATGIQEVVGGDIFFIDTESRRALHYADTFKFKHVPFNAPFGSLDYLEALKFCVKSGAGVVVVDSMSHEHEGPGGMIDLQEQVLTRLTKGDESKRNAMQMLAWAEPKAKRRQLINGILQLNSNFIFCFRAKNTSKPVKRDGRNVVEAQGFMPIAGEEFVFEQTLNALLLPGSGGVPTWHSDQVGERTMIKLPEQFAGLASRNRPLDEIVGKHLAKWATGDAPAKDEIADGPRQFKAVDSEAGDGFESEGFGGHAEGPADEQRGEAHLDETGANIAPGADTSPEATTARDITVQANAAQTADDLVEVEALAAQHRASIEAHDPTLMSFVDASIDAAERRISSNGGN